MPSTVPLPIMTPTASAQTNQRLPNDLVEDIIDLLALETSNERHLILSYVALVSRHFLHRSQSHLFRELTLRDAANRDHNKALFETSPHLLDHVQKVRIMGHDRCLSEDALWLLRHFRRLRKLHLRSLSGLGFRRTGPIQVTAELVETFGSIGSIEELALDNIVFGLSALRHFSNLRELYVIRKGPSSDLSSSTNAFKLHLPEMKTLAILNPAIELQTGVDEFVRLLSALESEQLARVIWQSVNSFFRKPTRLDPHFTPENLRKMFQPHAKTISSLEIEQCTALDLGSPESNRAHPWALWNLPRLRHLTFHALDRVEETRYSRSAPHYVHLSWLTAMVNSLTTPHPLESIRLLVGYQPGKIIHPEFARFERAVEVRKEMLLSLRVVELVHLERWSSPVDQAEWDTFARACLPGFAMDGMLKVGIPSVYLSR